MKESYWGFWLMLLGVFIVVALLFVQGFTTTNSQDYYLVETISEQAMLDAIDYAYFRQYGELKINKEKFFEVFIRRFAEEASISTSYKVDFIDIYEAPPKVTVKVTSKAGAYSFITNGADVVNRVDGKLEQPPAES